MFFPRISQGFFGLPQNDITSDRYETGLETSSGNAARPCPYGLKI